MKQLGIGVRVRVGWAPEHNLKPIRFDPRLRIATIIAGPHAPGLHRAISGEHYRTQYTMWSLQFDGGSGCTAAEHVLFPIDDDDDTQLEEPNLEELQA